MKIDLNIELYYLFTLITYLAMYNVTQFVKIDPNYTKTEIHFIVEH